MSDSTIKCDKCDEEFVDSESFESHKEMSHENDSFQFIDSRNAVDEEEFVRRNSTKGYNPNPNAGLYDNKLFREGSAKERTSMLGESKANELLSFDQASTLYGIKMGLEPDIISQASLDQLKMLGLVDDNNNLTPEGYRYSQNLQDQKPPLRDPEQKLNYTRTEDPHGGHYWDKYDKSWESKASEAEDEKKYDGFGNIDEDGFTKGTWAELQDDLDDQNEYEPPHEEATEGWREKERLRQPSDGNDYWKNTYILPTGDEAYARCTICGADVDTLTTDGDWMSDKEMLDHYDDHVSRGQITLYGESYAKEDEDQRDQSELETDTSYEDEIYGGNSGNPDNWYKTEDGEWEVVGDGESYAKEDDYKYDFDELSSLAQDKIEDGHISQLEWDDSSKEERKDLESVLHGDESDEDGTMLHGSGWNSGAETEPIESNDYLEARDQAISKALKAPIEVEDDYEKVDYEKEDELSAGFIEEQHTERTEDKNKFLDDIDISLENIDYVYPTKIGEAIGKSYITEAIEGLDEEYEGLEDSDEEEVIELVTERKMGGFSNESIARELHITYGVSPEYALSRVHGIEVSTNDKVANTFFGKKYKDCTESEKDELRMYSGSDY